MDVPAVTQPTVSMGSMPMNGLSAGVGGGDSGMGLMDLLGGVGGGVPMNSMY